MKRKSLVGWTEKKWKVHWKRKYFVGTIRTALLPNLYTRKEAKDDVKIRITIEEFK